MDYEVLQEGFGSAFTNKNNVTAITDGGDKSKVDENGRSTERKASGAGGGGGAVGLSAIEIDMDQFRNSAGEHDASGNGQIPNVVTAGSIHTRRMAEQFALDLEEKDLRGMVFHNINSIMAGS